MKIIIIGPNVGMGGVERASSNLANGLKRAGHQVTYLALIPETHFYELNTDYIEPIGFNEGHMNFLKTIRYIRKNVFATQPDHIIAFTKFYAALANLALYYSSYRIILTERSSPLYQWPKKIELICRFSYLWKKPKGVISQTSLASDYHKRIYGKKANYTIIPNALREIEFYPETKREHFFLAVGRFHDAGKGFDLLIEAFNLLENQDWRLVFAGGTKEDGQYLLDIAHPEIIPRIDFLGPVKNMDALYAKTGIFVIPSRAEGFPNALAEAMAAGCSCISFDFIAGPRDMIQDQVSGLLVENGNIELLAKSMDELISNPALRTEFEKKAQEIKHSLGEEIIIKKHIAFLLKS